MRKIAAILLITLLLAAPVRAENDIKHVALSFDDGPSGHFTRRLLEGLAARDAKATFLLCGYRVQNDPALTQRIFDEGHEIGIHGFSHESFCPMSAAKVTQEIRDTVKLLPAGCHPVFVRPPGGNCSAAVKEAAKRDGLSILAWEVDPQDWARSDKDGIVKAVTERVRDGDVILLHDMSDSSVDAALEIVDILSERGYRFVTASELARIQEVRLRAGREYRRFP